MIKFDEMQATKIPNFYGGEGAIEATMVVDELNKILKGRLVKGSSIGLHKHETSSEIIFILSGVGKTICDGVEEKLQSGDCHYCKKGSEHTLINIGDDDLIFYAVVPQQ
ncbi:MAG: cupin domain-containing protein [Clostridia bacterium]|nr:cupin domain-containing protein [Clostridia bacterium]MDE6758187.1 cupin domain-containing protein [Clostridia bacterium]